MNAVALIILLFCGPPLRGVSPTIGLTSRSEIPIFAPT
jgi:hypothetical protein